MIAGRYQRITKLGEGAHGEVWEGRDLLSGREVAIKLLRRGLSLSPARTQLEVTALRMRLPGVVELHDDGVEDGRAYLVMERVHGRPFPGKDGRSAWTDIAAVTAALLETLARVHTAGVVHRDLKPENVLVTGEGRIKLLDFGIARLTSLPEDHRLTEGPALFGTAAYMPPEQALGEAEMRSDLFAVGVMLYQALAGKLPFQSSTMADVARRKKPIPIEEIAADVPRVVADAISRLLEPAAKDRPRSAVEVLHLLRGERSVEAPHFPWLGTQKVLRALVTMVQAQRSVDLCGPRGAGRTRYLLALEQALGETRPVVWLTPSGEAFASLEPLTGSLSDDKSASFDEVRSKVLRAVREALGRGVVLFADDIENLDRESVSVLSTCQGEGSIVRTYQKDVKPGDRPRPRFARASVEEASVDMASLAEADHLMLTPLREKDLRSLFSGPDRLLHLQEDAARVLHMRTEGLPARVTEEVTRWVRLGVAHWMLDHLVVSRESIEMLGTGLLIAAPLEPPEGVLADVPSALVDLLAWLTMAFPHTDPSLLSRAADKPLFRIEAHLTALVDAGLAERTPSGAYLPRVTVSAAALWTEDRVKAAHGALARLLPPGAPGRLTHVWMQGALTADDRRTIALEAAAVAERLIDEGRLEPAIVTLERGIRQVRHLGAEASGEMERLLALWAVAAIELGTKHALDRALFEICRAEPRSALERHIEELCRAALGTEEFTERPLERIDRVPRFDAPRLERARLSVRALAARHLTSRAAEEAVLREIAKELPAGDLSAEASLTNFWGRLRYQQGRFQEAADLHRDAAEKAESPLVKTYSCICAALSYMDAFAFEEAKCWAHRARELARPLRHAYYEALSEWLLRTLAYRQGDVSEPDRELADTSAHVGVKQLEGMITFNEAAVARRAGKADLTRELALRAHEVFSSIREQGSTLLSRCLAIAAGDKTDESEVAALCDAALGPLLPGIGLQALALLAEASALPRSPPFVPRIEELCSAVPREHWERRMDVLSVSECLSRLRAG